LRLEPGTAPQKTQMKRRETWNLSVYSVGLLDPWSGIIHIGVPIREFCEPSMKQGLDMAVMEELTWDSDLESFGRNRM